MTQGSSFPKLKIACQMDHIRDISIQGDSSFAMLLEAQKRGHLLYHYTADRLGLLNNQLYADIEPLEVRDVEGDHYHLGDAQHVNLKSMDVILMRQDPPFNMHYITATHFLERLKETTLVVNNPEGVRNAPEKILVTEFHDLMPETLITRDVKMIRAFRETYQDIILKPLYGNGGQGVFRLDKNNQNFDSLLEMFSQNFVEPFILQRFLPDIIKGDKRILLVNGAVAGAINRIPAQGDIRSNLVRGGRAQACDLTSREEEICARIAPVLKEKGFLFTGIDVIGDYMTEINVTSPTGIRALKNLGGPDVAVTLLDAIEKEYALHYAS